MFLQKEFRGHQLRSRFVQVAGGTYLWAVQMHLFTSPVWLLYELDNKNTNQ
jgi:hypothetical protein